MYGIISVIYTEHQHQHVLIMTIYSYKKNEKAAFFCIRFFIQYSNLLPLPLNEFMDIRISLHIFQNHFGNSLLCRNILLRKSKRIRQPCDCRSLDRLYHMTDILHYFHYCKISLLKWWNIIKFAILSMTVLPTCACNHKQVLDNNNTNHK